MKAMNDLGLMKDLDGMEVEEDAGILPAMKAMNDLGLMKDLDGMEVEEDAGRMPALPGHNRDAVFIFWSDDP